MTCPSCGTIAAEDLERCKRCGASLAPPERQPDFPVPVPRSPTARGALAQRAAGVVPQVLARPKTETPEPAVGAPHSPQAPAAPAPAPAAPGAGATPAFAVPPPPPPLAGGYPPVPADASAADHTLARPSEPGRGLAPPVDPTAVLPAESARAEPPEVVGARDEGRPRRGDDPRPRLDAPWPPPPGPWSGRRSTTES
jgi:hypothetical protein